MSTWLYLECADHEPPLVSEGESGQHLEDLEQIRADIASREAIANLDLPDIVRETAWMRANTFRFLKAHPHCNIRIRDEYGRLHDLEGGVQ